MLEWDESLKKTSICTVEDMNNAGDKEAIEIEPELLDKKVLTRGLKYNSVVTLEE